MTGKDGPHAAIVPWPNRSRRDELRGECTTDLFFQLNCVLAEVALEQELVRGEHGGNLTGDFFRVLKLCSQAA